MPKKSARKCNVIGCSNLSYDSYCSEHAVNVVRESHKEYKRTRTDKTEQAFYSSKEWIRLRNYKKGLNPLCEHCLRDGKATPVDAIDHIVEVKDDWSLRLTLSNLQSLCNACHNRKTAMERRQRTGNK